MLIVNMDFFLLDVQFIISNLTSMLYKMTILFICVDKSNYIIVTRTIVMLVKRNDMLWE